MRLLLLPRGDSRIAFETSLSAWGLFLSVADLNKGAKKKAKRMCFDAFWWAKMTFMIYFERGELFVG